MTYKCISETGVQQGDPIGPLFFDLVLQKIVSAIDTDDECLDLLYQAWYHDDGILAGTKSALVRALTLIEELGPTVGIFINLSKCEIFCRTNTAMFPTSMKVSHAPHLDILGAPVGDYLHCANFISAKRNEAVKLLSKIKDITAIDPQVAFNILRMCGAFCKLVHLARSTPPSLAFDPLTAFDAEVRECFVFSFILDLTDSAWQQAQLSLKYGGLGLRSVALHSCAAYIASVCATGIEGNHHLTRAIDAFNTLVSPQDAVTRLHCVITCSPEKPF